MKYQLPHVIYTNDITALNNVTTETIPLCTVTYLLMIISQHCTSLALHYSATTAHTEKPTVFKKGSVHCSAALPNPMHYLSVKMKRQGGGVGNIIETDCVLRSFGLAAGPGLYTAVKLISDTDRGERA